MADQTEREVLGRLILGYDYSELNLPSRKNELDRERAFRKADDILAAGFHRTPTPHVVTTEQIQAWMNESWSDSDEHGGTAAYIAERLSATVLTPAPAPVDREALEAAVVSVIGPNPRHRYLPDKCDGCAGVRDQARAVLDAIEGVSRG